MAKERSTILVALGMGLLAGILAALGIVLLSSGAAVGADESTPRLPPGVDLVTEEVEPGVFRVLSDGQRDLSMPVAFNQVGGVANNKIVVAPDGNVWIFGPDEFFRLGDGTAHAGFYWGDVVDVDADGLVWAIGGYDADMTDGCRNYGPPHLLAFDGTEWKAKLCNVLDFQLHPDGSPWVAIEVIDESDPYPGRFAFGRVREGAWEQVRGSQPYGWGAMPLPQGFRGFAMRPPTEADDPDHDTGWLVDGAGELQLIELFPDGGGSGGPNAEGETVAVGFGSDHTSWAFLRFEEASATDGFLSTEQIHLLARFPPMPAGRDQYPERMDVYESELDPQSLLDTCCGIAPRLDVAPDGSVWLPGNQGLARFDGETWDWYLEGRPIEDIDIATDGTVWAQANDLDKGPGVAYWEQEGITSTYVITSEPVAAAE